MSILLLLMTIPERLRSALMAVDFPVSGGPIANGIGHVPYFLVIVEKWKSMILAPIIRTLGMKLCFMQVFSRVSSRL